MENEIQESLEGSEEINPFQFGNTIEDPFEIIAKRKENYFAKCELFTVKIYRFIIGMQ